MPNWSQVLTEITGSPSGMDGVRRKYLKQLQRRSKRNIIAYYSGYLSKPGVGGTEITDEDTNAFMMAVHGLDRSKGLDLILHTPGGVLSATQAIVHYLHQMFGNDIRAIVPQIAMSAGTMIACSCKTILMAKHSSLGPIDPQVAGVPAYGVLHEFERAMKEIKKDPTRVPMWQAIVGQYRPTFLTQCENAIKLSGTFVRRELRNNMFKGDPKATAKAARVVTKLSDFKGNKAHDRHIHIDECQRVGLKVEPIETDQKFQDLVLTVHHAYMHALTNTNAYKIIENQDGVAFVKQVPVHVLATR